MSKGLSAVDARELSVSIAMKARGMAVLKKHGAAALLRRAGVLVEAVQFDERDRTVLNAHRTTTGSAVWAPRWAVALLDAEPVSQDVRWAAVRRAVHDQAFRDSLLTVLDASDDFRGRYRALANYVQDQPDEVWIGYAGGEP